VWVKATFLMAIQAARTFSEVILSFVQFDTITQSDASHSSVVSGLAERDVM
jgi:hypothetical protein